MGSEHPETLTAMANLAETLVAEGDHAEAQGLGVRALEGRREC